jgi:hypothetical protein
MCHHIVFLCVCVCVSLSLCHLASFAERIVCKEEMSVCLVVHTSSACLSYLCYAITILTLVLY